MEDLIAKIVADTGVSPDVARKSVIIILKFVRQEAPADKVDDLLDALPGAREALEADGPGGPDGLMAAFNALTSAGLGMMQVQSVVESFGRHAREQAKPGTVEAIVASVPGLGQFV